MTPLFHRGGPVPCGHIALYVRLEQNQYELTADNVRRLDGTSPKRGDAVICGACGQPIVSQWLFPSSDSQPITVA